MSFTIGMYTIRLEETNKGTVTDLDLENNEYRINVRDEIISFIKFCTKVKSTENKKYLSHKKTMKNEAVQISGIFRSGHFGREKDVENIDTGLITHTITPEEAETLPFYYLIDFSRKKSTQYFLILSRIDNFGIKEVFEKEFNRFFKQKNEIKGLNIKFHNLLPEQVLQNYINNGKVRKLIMKKHSVPKDFSTYLSNNGAIPEDYEIEVILKPKKRKAILPIKLDKLFSRGTSSKNLIEIKNRDLEYDSMNIEVIGPNKKPQIFKLDSPDTFKGYRDVTSKVNEQANGHPDLDQLEKISIEYMAEVTEVITGK